MLALPDHPALDKRTLIGGCVRLPLRVDAQRLRAEFEALPAEALRSTDGRIEVHRATRGVFLRGYAPAEGDKPIEDRPALDAMPYARQIIEALIPAPPMRCLLATLPAGAAIAIHVDQLDYFSKTLRLHLPVITHDQALMYCNGRVYRMGAGEVWALNNSTLHGVWNAHERLPRTHLICDFLPTPALLELLRQGEAGLGSIDHVAERFLAEQPPR
jgi:hypothetical protein